MVRPYLKKDMDILKKVQKRDMKEIFYGGNSSLRGWRFFPFAYPLLQDISIRELNCSAFKLLTLVSLNRLDPI